MLPLEDFCEDILSKAARGTALSPAALAKKAGLSEDEVQRCLSGDEKSERCITPLAKALELSPTALLAISSGTYSPQTPPLPPNIRSFQTPFDDMIVNSYLVWDEASREAIAFDTGTDCSELLEVLSSENLELRFLLLTHTHGDHVYELDRILEKTKAQAFTPEKEPLDGATPFSPGKIFTAGTLRVQARSTWGHSPGGTTFVISGLSAPVAVVGDALFAGSMGGPNISYKAALETAKTQILSLPGETILCPGHGPLTTVEQELQSNPFFAA